MALAKDLAIYKATYELTSKIVSWKANFPRMYRYDLGEKMTNTALELFEYVQLYNMSFGDRYKNMVGFTVKYELLGTLLRLSFERKLFSLRQQADICRMMTSIGRQATALRKASQAVAPGAKKQESHTAKAYGRSNPDNDNGLATVSPQSSRSS